MNVSLNYTMIEAAYRPRYGFSIIIENKSFICYKDKTMNIQEEYQHVSLI